VHGEGSCTVTMTRSRPPQREQARTSKSNTRRIRAAQGQALAAPVARGLASNWRAAFWCRSCRSLCLSGINRTACEPYFSRGVTTARLSTITDLFDRGKLTARVGAVLPLEQAGTAQEMLGGAPHSRGKIVLHVAGGSSRGGD
jgi:Zinc-binding dehydrogenase